VDGGGLAVGAGGRGDPVSAQAPCAQTPVMIRTSGSDARHCWEVRYASSVTGSGWAAWHCTVCGRLSMAKPADLRSDNDPT
jgi:hypothetical protein